MTRVVDIVEATPAHVEAMAPRVRELDAAEVMAFAGVTPRQALDVSLNHSVLAWTWMVDGEPGCMWGVCCDSLIGNTGYPWLLSTDAVIRHPIAFLKGSRKCITRMLAAFPHLDGYVDARHIACVRWLAWLGFMVEDAKPVGIAGLPFHRFQIGK